MIKSIQPNNSINIQDEYDFDSRYHINNFQSTKGLYTQDKIDQLKSNYFID